MGRLRGLVSWALACGVALGGCASTEDGAPATSAGALISDGAHAGTAGFYFLPPLQPARLLTGVFEPRLEARVDIAALNANGTVAANLGRYSTVVAGPGGALVVVDTAAYGVDVPLAALGATAGMSVRAIVSVPRRTLGFIDVSLRGVVGGVTRAGPIGVPWNAELPLSVRFWVKTGVVDRDGDGVLDYLDNCPTVANAGQLDSNGDGIGDACQCLGVRCPGATTCFQAGRCDPKTGKCVVLPSVRGTRCDDGNKCTRVDTCDGAGHCIGGSPVVCTALSQCTVPGVCDPSTGACSNPAKPAGTACNDGNKCTRVDQCDGAGHCVGGDPIQCGARSQCHDVGQCAPATGLCSDPFKPAGAACDDGDRCTELDACDGAGICVGSVPVVCTALSQCHDVGVCDPASGLCSQPPAPPGRACTDENSSTQADACDGAGQCLGVPPPLPYIVRSAPAAGELGVALGAPILAEASTELAPATVSESSVRVRSGAQPVRGAVALDGRVVTFVPRVPLRAATTYTVTLAGSITDLDGNALPEKSWTFTTTVAQACATDGDCLVDACQLARCVAGLCRAVDRVCEPPAPSTDPLDACRLGAATFDVILGGQCNTTCDPVDGCDARPVAVPCPPADALAAAPPAHRLAQTEAYMVVLRNYLSTLAAQDFAITLPDFDPVTAGVQPFQYDDAWFTGPEAKERLFELWMYAASNGNDMPTTRGLRLPPEGFTLGAIENEALGYVRLTTESAGIDPATTAWWTTWAYPGNPYRVGNNARAGRLRALVAAMVDMVMRDRWAGDYPSSPVAPAIQYLSTGLAWQAYAYDVGKGDLDACTRAAYELGLRRSFARAEAKPYATANGNNDIPQMVHAGMYFAARAIGDPALKARALAFSNRIFALPYRSPAGYFAHSTVRDAGRSYDPSYEGITLRFLSWTAMASYADPDYAGLREKVAQQVKLKVYQMLPEPDGRYFGPSHFANATNAPAPIDQWSNRARDYGLSMVSDEGKVLAFTKRLPTAVNVGVPTETEMRTKLRAAAVNMARATTGPQFGAAAAWAAKAWFPSVWSETLTGGHFYRPGFYAELEAARAASAPWTRVPFLRDGDVLETFADEFLAAKLGGFGVLIHSGTVAQEWGGCDPDVLTNGFGGGALSAFWTPGGGSLLLGVGNGFQSPAPNRWSLWRTWPTHAVSGETATGAFSSARILNPTRSLSVDPLGRASTVVVSGTIQRAEREFAAQLGALTSPLAYERTFEVRGDGPALGVTVSTLLEGDGLNEVQALYESLPLFLLDASQPQATVNSLVTFVHADGTTETFSGFDVADHASADVIGVRVQRWTGTLTIQFERAESVRLSPAVASVDYQWRPRGRALLVDLLRGPGPVAFERAAIRYRISPVGCAAPTDCDSGVCISSVCAPVPSAPLP